MKKSNYGLAVEFQQSASACKKVAKDVARLAEKYGRAAAKEKGKRRAELESLSIYSEVDVQNMYGYGEITLSQYDRYLDMLREGEAVLENQPQTVNDLAQKILLGYQSELLKEVAELELLALTPEARQLELERREVNLQNWKTRMKKLKEELSNGA